MGILFAALMLFLFLTYFFLTSLRRESRSSPRPIKNSRGGPLDSDGCQVPATRASSGSLVDMKIASELPSLLIKPRISRPPI
jgi:hypothetical protein